MRIAWFRPREAAAGTDHLGHVLQGLRASHVIECVDEARAHDFVWQQARGRFDLCVYELDNTARHQYMWPYLLHYPGVLALQSSTIHDARRARLVHEGRHADYRAEIAFAGGPSQVRPPWHMARGQWPMLRIPVAASRLTVVADETLAEYVARAIPGAQVRIVATGVPDPTDRLHDAVGGASGKVTVAAVEPARREVVERAVARLVADGVAIEVAASDALSAGTGASGAAGIAADIVVAVRWPLHGRPLVSALLSMAAGKPTIVADTHVTAQWPALDPQTWRPREQGRTASEPAVISLDPRDEEHSLVVALRRLAADGRLRASLGRAARAWWATHGTIDRAVAGWTSVLTEAATMTAPARPAGWPEHLDADGSRLTQQILRDCGVEHDQLAEPRYLPSAFRRFSTSEIA